MIFFTVPLIVICSIAAGLACAIVLLIMICVLFRGSFSEDQAEKLLKALFAICSTVCLYFAFKGFF